MRTQTTQELFEELKACFKAIDEEGVKAVWGSLRVISGQAKAGKDIAAEMQRRYDEAVMEESQEGK